MARWVGAILAALLLAFVWSCGQRAVQPGAPDAAETAAYIDDKEDRSWTASQICQLQRATEPEQCDERCLLQQECIPVQGGEGALTCVECVIDAHCRANPFARSPRCDRVFGLCGCETAEDCGGCHPGGKCMATGMPSPAICGCDTLGPTRDCPPDTVCNGLSCQLPCRPQDCDSPNLCDQRPQSGTFGVCVRCLTDADCAQHEDKPICVADYGA
jgi:hypothetical protein